MYQIDLNLMHFMPGLGMPYQLGKIEDYAKTNEMIINQKKTKLMIFNPCISKDFMCLVWGFRSFELISTQLFGAAQLNSNNWPTHPRSSLGG
jgi:hypothetical protein